MELIFAPVPQEDHSPLDSRRCRRLDGSEDGVPGRAWQGPAGGWEWGAAATPALAAAFTEGRLPPGLGRSGRAGGGSRSCSLLLDGADLSWRAGAGALSPPPALVCILPHPCLLRVESIWKGAGRWRHGGSVTISRRNPDRGVWPEKNRQRTGQLAVSISQWR